MRKVLLLLLLISFNLKSNAQYDFSKLKISFVDGVDIISNIEDADPTIYQQEKEFLDSLKDWKRRYPDYRLKNQIRPVTTNSSKEYYIKIDSCLVDLLFEGSVKISNYKMKGSIIPDDLMHQIIKYTPEGLKIVFKDIYLRVLNNSATTKYERCEFDFRR